MSRMSVANLDAFVRSPEFKTAYLSWRKQYTAKAMIDLSPTALEVFPVMPTRWWHVQGELMCNDTVLDATRVVSATDEAEAIRKIAQAAQSARGGEWTWVTSPIVVRHAARDDESCPICRKRLETFPYQQSGRVNILRDNPDLCEYCGAEKYTADCCQTRHHTIQPEDDHEYCGCEPTDEYARRIDRG